MASNIDFSNQTSQLRLFERASMKGGALLAVTKEGKLKVVDSLFGKIRAFFCSWSYEKTAIETAVTQVFQDTFIEHLKESKKLENVSKTLKGLQERFSKGANGSGQYFQSIIDRLTRAQRKSTSLSCGKDRLAATDRLKSPQEEEAAKVHANLESWNKSNGGLKQKAKWYYGLEDRDFLEFRIKDLAKYEESQFKEEIQKIVKLKAVEKNYVYFHKHFLKSCVDLNLNHLDISMINEWRFVIEEMFNKSLSSNSTHARIPHYSKEKFDQAIICHMLPRLVKELTVQTKLPSYNQEEIEIQIANGAKEILGRQDSFEDLGKSIAQAINLAFFEVLNSVFRIEIAKTFEEEYRRLQQSRVQAQDLSFLQDGEIEQILSEALSEILGEDPSLKARKGELSILHFIGAIRENALEAAKLKAQGIFESLSAANQENQSVNAVPSQSPAGNPSIVEKFSAGISNLVSKLTPKSSSNPLITEST